jgi:hypothetical protein
MELSVGSGVWVPTTKIQAILAKSRGKDGTMNGSLLTRHTMTVLFDENTLRTSSSEGKGDKAALNPSKVLALKGKLKHLKPIGRPKFCVYFRFVSKMGQMYR